MSSPDQLFLAYFDTLGFECILNLTKIDKKMMWASLGDKTIPNEIPLHQMIMRAKSNPQRFPEIWTFWSSVDQEVLLQYAEDEPQALADSIRRIGDKVFVTSKEKAVIQ